MTSLLRIAAAKGGCPAIHATVVVPSAQPGCRRPEEIAVIAVDGSEGTVPIPPDAEPGETLRVVVPSAYPNWGPGPKEYAGDWVATYSAGNHAPGRGTWATERIPPHIHSDPGFLLRQGQIDGGRSPNASAERFRRAAEDRNATHTLAAKRQQEHTTGGTASPIGATLDEVREKAAEVVRLHTDLVEGSHGGGPVTLASVQPGRTAVGRSDSVVAAVERLRTGMVEGGAACHEAIADLRFVCRQNLRPVEREHQTAAGTAGAVELLCEMIAGHHPVPAEGEERAAATWLLAQLCFKHRANCARVLAYRDSLHAIVRSSMESQLQTARRIIVRARDQSGPRAAAFSLLCNLASHGPDGTGNSIVQAGAVGAALTVIAAYETDMLEPESSDESDSDDGRTVLGATQTSSAQGSDKPGTTDKTPRRGATRAPEVLHAEGPRVDLELVLKAVVLLESLASCDECRTSLVEAGVPDALHPLAMMSGVSTGHLPGQRVPFAGASLGAVAARALADL